MITRRNMKPGRTGPVVTAVALAAALSLSGCGTSTPGPGKSDQLALSVLKNLTATSAAATTDFSPAMAQILPAEALAQNWQRYQELLGNYQSHGQPQDVDQGDFTVVNVPLSMERKPGQLRITVDHDGRIAGLFLLDADTPMPVRAAFEPPQAAGTATNPPAVVLNPSQVRRGLAYSVSVSGFTPGEDVAFSWTGPTHGVMGTFPAGPDGRGAIPDPIIGSDPPGDYAVIATGAASGHTATAPLRIIADTGR